MAPGGVEPPHADSKTARQTCACESFAPRTRELRPGAGAVATMATLDVRSRSVKCSLAGRHSAQRCGLNERQRTDANAAPNRQAGGHWFEPSTAHRKPCKRAPRVCRRDDAPASMATPLGRSSRQGLSAGVSASRRGNGCCVRSRSHPFGAGARTAPPKASAETFPRCLRSRSNCRSTADAHGEGREPVPFTGPPASQNAVRDAWGYAARHSARELSHRPIAVWAMSEPRILPS
jgi:hypothetical protein